MGLFRRQKKTSTSFEFSYFGRGEIRVDYRGSHISFEGEMLHKGGYFLYPPKEQVCWNGERDGDPLTDSELSAVKEAFLRDHELNEWVG